MLFILPFRERKRIYITYLTLNNRSNLGIIDLVEADLTKTYFCGKIPGNITTKDVRRVHK